MAFIIKDRVKEGTTSTGTGAVSLGGATATFDTFQSYMTNGDTTYYAIVHTTSGTDEWEVGIGTWNTGNTLTRTTVLAGSNGASAVNFSAGTKDIFMTYPASKAVYTDASGDIDINGGTIDGTTIGATTADTGKFTTLETTSNADIGGYIDLEILSDHAAYKEGRVWYDSVHKTINYYSDDSDVIHEVGLEEHQRVYNNTGSTITKGSPLYFSGNYTAGTIDVPTVALANATDVNKYNAQGLAASDIADGSYGYCIIAGQLDGLDTSGLTAGQNFFVGLTDGAVQNSSPVYPNYPMCLGWVVNSDSTDGILLVNQQNHSVNSFRVRTDAHIGDDLIVGGNLTVQGTQTTTSSNNVELGASFQYLNSGDTIGASGTSQTTGSGLDDATLTGHFTGTASKTFYVKIDGTGTPDTFSWSDDNFATTEATAVSITGNDQTLADGISVKFAATTGHTLGDIWSGTAAPAAVDTGLFTNRNTGGSGVGYTHMGFFYDVSTEKWVLLDAYDPEPSGTINLADSSVAYATLKAGTFEGDLTGDVTGDVTGNASTADSLSTSRTIGGVAFNGTANINLPGVNTTGNQDTSGNAATATALETARTIQLTGDVTGSATFDGSANASITATVQDDSHAHVISNVDGLQTALDDKTDTTRTITAGNGLTGGGDLSANRTLTVGAGTGVTVNANDVAIGQDVSTTSNVTFNNITVTGTVDGRDVAADGTKLDGIESGAEVNDPAFKNIAVSGQSTVVADADADTLNLAAGSNVTITTNASTDTVTIASTDTNTVPNNATITISAGSALTGGGNFTTDQASNETITINHQDTSSQASVNNSGRTYIQDITLDTYGHVTGISSATETVVNTDTNTNQLTTFQLEDGDGTEVTISHGKEVKFVEAGGININWTDTSTGSDGDPYDMSFSVNTGVTAGNGLTGGGTLNATRTLNVGAGSGITVSADAVAHSDTSTLSGTYGSTSDGTKIDQITVDGFGHITAITTGATGDIQGVTAGSGLTGGGTSGTVTVSHADTSSQASVNNSGSTFIQDITLDTYGHVTGLTSATAAGVPSGVIVMWSGTNANIPSGWNLCDGTNSTPDLRDRFVVGSGSTYTTGDTGGANTVTLSTANLPSHAHGAGNIATGGGGDHSHNFNTNTGNAGSHSHSGSTSNTGSHNHTARWANSFGGNNRFHQMKTAQNYNNNSAISNTGAHSHNFNTNNAGDHSHNFNANTGNSGNHTHTISGNTGNAGSGTAHENRPAYYAIAYIMKA